GACFLYLIQEGGSTKDVTLRDNVEPPALRGRNPYAGLQDAGHAEVGTGRAGFSRPSLPIRSAFLIACAFFSNFMQFIFGYSNLRGISLFLGLLMDVVRADQIICMGLLQCERHLQQHQRRAMGALWMQRLFLYRYDDG